MLILNKLKEARELLKLKQNDIESESGIRQNSISYMEGGKVKPSLKYLSYLQSKGISMDALFDDKISVEGFIKRFRGEVVPVQVECQKCPEKDERIRELKGYIKTLTDLNERLTAENNRLPAKGVRHKDTG